MARIQTLGLSLPPASGLEIGQVSQPANLPVTASPTGDASATGTPSFGGFLRELGEYNADLAWPASYLVYEQMRRSDAQVAATLWASKLPIRGDWLRRKMGAPDKPAGARAAAPNKTGSAAPAAGGQAPRAAAVGGSGGDTDRAAGGAENAKFGANSGERRRGQGPAKLARPMAIMPAW